eukprot:s1120_g9.t1
MPPPSPSNEPWYVKVLHRLIFFMPPLEILMSLPTVWYLAPMFDPFVAIALVCLRFLQCGFRLHQMMWLSALVLESPGCPEYMIAELATCPALDRCCSRLLSLLLMVLDILWVLMLLESPAEPVFTVVLMIGNISMLTCDFVVLFYLSWKRPLTLPVLPPRPRAVQGVSTATARAKSRPRPRERKGDPTVPVIIKLEADEAPDICSICLGDLRPGDDAQQLPCQHVFHTHCIREWLLRSSYCPLRCPQQVLPVETSWSPRRIEFVGILLVLGSICFNCLGALLVEKFLKANGQLYEQKAQLLLGEVLVNSFLVFVAPLFIRDPEVRVLTSPWERGFFVGWDRRVLACAILWIPAGWTATMLVKRCSNVLKTVAQASSSVLTYVFSVVPLSSGPQTWAQFVTFLGPPLTPEPVSSPVVLLAISVMISALTFGADRREPSRSKMSRRPGASRSSKDEVPESWKVDGSYLQAWPRSRQISGESVGR